MNNNTEGQSDALDTEIWLPLKEAASRACRNVVTLKRAIHANKIVGRKVGEANNSSYEISKSSLEDWLKKQKPPACIHPLDTEQAAHEEGSNTISELDKNARRKLKASQKKKDLPESARHLRRWKNFMRHASQEQSLAMIKWLFSRLPSKKDARKKMTKEALKESDVPTNSPA